MTEPFAATFLHLALAVTQAERGMAVTPDRQIVTLINLTDETVNADDFTGFDNIARAQELAESPHLTNNLILDPEAAPNTNTNFANLRIVAILLLGDAGAVYLDQPVRQGVFPQAVLQRLADVSSHVLQSGNLAITADQLKALFENT